LKTPQKREYGFTLLEILVTLFIFGVIAGTLFIAYRALFFDTERFNQTTRRFAQAQAGIQRMLTDLQAIRVTTTPLYTAPQGDAPPDPFRFVGQTEFTGEEAFSNLRFASSAHVPVGQHRDSGIATIRYYVARSAEGTSSLRRSDQLYTQAQDDGVSTDPTLCEAVYSFRVTYYAQNGEAYDHWDSDSVDFAFATPVAVQLEFEIGAAGDAVVFKTRINLPVRREARATL